MLIGFIDESGKPSLNDKNARHYVLACILTQSDETINFARSKLNEIKVEYKLPQSVEFHAKNLYNAKKSKDNPFTNLTKEQLIQIEQKIANLIRNLDITIISTVVDFGRVKSLLTKSNIILQDWMKEQIEYDIKKKAYELLLERILIHADKSYPNDWILLIHDSVSTSGSNYWSKEQTDIRKIIDSLIKDDSTFIYKKSSKSRLFPIIFANSKELEMLQLADFVAYIIRQKVSGNNKFNYFELYDIIKEKIAKSRDETKPIDERIKGYGIKIWYY